MRTGGLIRLAILFGLLGGLSQAASAQSAQNQTRPEPPDLPAVPQPEQSVGSATQPQPDQADRDATAQLERSPYDEEGKPPPGCVDSPTGRICFMFTPRNYPVSQAEAPWQVSIWSFKYNDYTAEELHQKPEWIRRHKCGGTLITSEWVLTAAHCVTGSLADHPMQVLVGTNRMGNNSGRLHKVRRKIAHPAYAADRNADIALLQIEPVRDSRTATATLSRTTPRPTEFPEAKVYGFGRTRSAAVSAYLLSGNVRIWKAADCEAAYPGQLGRVRNRSFCANAPEVDSCQGDSGGPMMLDNVQVGVVSRGEGCGRLDKPGIYINVAEFLPWIRRQVGRGLKLD